VRSRRRFLKDSAALLGAAPVIGRVAGTIQRATEFDYVIVGAGASGCVLAERLSAGGGNRVLVVEAGGPDTNPLIRMPGKWTSLLGTELDWQYLTEPEPALGGRRVAWPRGKTYGGSTAIHAMAYVRGHRRCFEGWARDGGSAWGYDALLPIFKQIEDNSRAASAHLGSGGPLAVSDTTDPHEGHFAFLEAARLRGFTADPAWDFNAPAPEGGAGFYQKNIRNGRRDSAADAFLRPALARPNVEAWPNTAVRRVTFAGARATGIECVRSGEVVRVRAARGVILAAGVIESPKLLMLSGIGPADQLRRHGVPVVADLRSVGANLHDHPRVSVRWASRRTFPPSTVSAGLLAFSSREVGPRPPDIQFYVGRGIDTPDETVTLTVAISQPQSRGSISLRSADPADPPVIRANYFADPSDLDAMVEAVELAHALAGTRPYEGLRGEPLAPNTPIRSPDEVRAHILATCETMFHPAGTCRMGSDADSVVDPELRVRGVEGLSVVDGSVMPTVVNNQTQAAALAIGAKGAV